MAQIVVGQQHLGHRPVEEALPQRHHLRLADGRERLLGRQRCLRANAAHRGAPGRDGA